MVLLATSGISGLFQMQAQLQLLKKVEQKWKHIYPGGQNKKQTMQLSISVF